MKLIDEILRIIGNKPKTKAIVPTKCNHDWEATEFSGWYRIGGSCFAYYRKDKQNIEKFIGKIKDSYACKLAIHKIYNKVCLKCGECQDNTEIIKQKLTTQAQNKVKKIKEKRERKVLAQKLWEDRCCEST